ncbi:hypothetical protein J0X20_03240 [Streptomyces sp. KCTC 0041BP]|uniref:hypothetical protein n=1 Tax=Streptomyces sp. KCTC 0041BP TaxID=201500 RepID=UPI001AE6531E|nr:hypothetical protein [Streptomyces sp. KCTC 0041BP]MBP0932631.1 hypothetical protein [Streptomyces sp. KCTC 0041BP]
MSIEGVTKTIGQWLAKVSLSQLIKLPSVKIDPVMLYQCANYLRIFEKPKYTHPEDTGQPCRDAKGTIIPNTRVEGDKCVNVSPTGRQQSDHRDMNQQSDHRDMNQQSDHRDMNQQSDHRDMNQQPDHQDTNQQPGGDEQPSTQLG